MRDDDDGWLSRRTFLQASAATMLVTQPALARAKAAGGRSTPAGYLVQRLSEHGARVLFGVPGATCDPLFAAAAAEGSGMDVVITASDLEAGYAADGYARLAGLGALSVTYGVGTMSLLAVIGGAYAERSPLVVMNGGPNATDLKLMREYDTYFSHSIGKERTDLVVFREVTAYAARAESTADVPRVVDEAVATALREKRPVYIEVPKHLWDAPCDAPKGPLDVSVAPTGNEGRLADELLGRLKKAKRPALLLGVEVQRHGIADEVGALVQKLGIPFATTMLGKSVLPETTPGYAGTYAGMRSVPALRTFLEDADAVLALGCVFGRQYRDLVTKKPDKMLVVGNGAVRIGKKATPARLGAVVAALNGKPWTKNAAHAKQNPLEGLSFEARRSSLGERAVPSGGPGGELTYDKLLAAVSAQLDEGQIVITDTSLSMYPAADLNVAGRNAFVCNGVWQAIGFSVGAAAGVALVDKRRPLAICGDGGFQMTAQGLSTLARRNLDCTVVVLDNGRYGIEQFLLDARYFSGEGRPGIPYLDLNRWDYVAFAKALGLEAARAVGTVPELQQALKEARGHKGPAFIAARIPPRDLPGQLRS